MLQEADVVELDFRDLKFFTAALKLPVLSKRVEIDSDFGSRLDLNYRHSAAILFMRIHRGFEELLVRAHE